MKDIHPVYFLWYSVPMGTISLQGAGMIPSNSGRSARAGWCGLSKDIHRQFFRWFLFPMGTTSLHTPSSETDLPIPKVLCIDRKIEDQHGSGSRISAGKSGQSYSFITILSTSSEPITVIDTTVGSTVRWLSGDPMMTGNHGQTPRVPTADCCRMKTDITPRLCLWSFTMVEYGKASSTPVIRIETPGERSLFRQPSTRISSIGAPGRLASTYPHGRNINGSKEIWW